MEIIDNKEKLLVSKRNHRKVNLCISWEEKVNGVVLMKGRTDAWLIGPSRARWPTGGGRWIERSLCMGSQPLN